MKRYFVVVCGNRDGLLVIHDENEELATWQTPQEASAACRDHPLIRAYGGEIHHYGSSDAEFVQ